MEKETYEEYKSRKGITDEYIASIELAKDSVTILTLTNKYKQKS